LTTRREAERAVVEAAKKVYEHIDPSAKHSICGEFPARECSALKELLNAARALDALPADAPDLDALNAAVAEAVEGHARAFPDLFTRRNYDAPEWTTVITAHNARRAALTKKPRYEEYGQPKASTTYGIFDNAAQRALPMSEVAALLNEREK
jgi:hypothetical protein